MEKEEYRRQLIMAKAKLDRLIELKAVDMATGDEIAFQRQIFQKLKSFDVDKIEVKTEVFVEVFAKNVVKFNDKDESTDENLKAIYNELAQIDNHKSLIINELQKADRKVNQRELVQRIKALRKDWVNKSDEVYYYKRHGERMSEPVELTFSDNSYVASLPRDKVELFRLRKNLEANASKYKNRLRSAKTDVKKASQEKNLAIAQIKLNVIDQLMGTL